MKTITAVAFTMVIVSSTCLADETGVTQEEAISKVQQCSAFLSVQADVRKQQGLNIREEVQKEPENYPMLYIMALLGAKQMGGMSDREFGEFSQQKRDEALANIPNDSSSSIYQSYQQSCKQGGEIYKLAKALKPSLIIKFK